MSKPKSEPVQTWGILTVNRGGVLGLGVILCETEEAAKKEAIRLAQINPDPGTAFIPLPAGYIMRPKEPQEKDG